MAKLRVIDGPPKTIKVFAANETLRGALRHANGTRFQSKIDQGVEWPNDSFTTRRLAEGSVLTEAPSGGAAEAKPDPTKNVREQAEANKPKKKAEGKPTNGKPQVPPAAGAVSPPAA